MKFFKQIIALFFIFLILNQDIVVNAHNLSKSRESILRVTTSETTSKPSASKLFSNSKAKETASSVVKTTKATSEVSTTTKGAVSLLSNTTSTTQRDTTSGQLTAETRAKLAPLLIVAITLIVVIVVFATTKSIIDKVAKRELKEISKEINNAKWWQAFIRKKENSLLIQICLAFQQTRKLFKAHSVLGDFARVQVTSAFADLKDLPKPKNQEKKNSFELLVATALNTASKSVAYSNLKTSLDDSFTKYCYDGYVFRQQLREANVIGDLYTGFDIEDYKELEESQKVLKAVVVDKSFGGAVLKSTGETVVMSKFGSEATAQIIDIADFVEGGEVKETEGYSILGDSDKPTWLMDYAGATGIVSSIVQLKTSYNELKKNFQEVTVAEQKVEGKWIKKGFDYIMFTIEALDKVIGIVSGALDFAHIDFSFPFFSVATEARKTLKAVEDWKKALTSATGSDKGMELQKHLKFWDALDQMFSFLKEVSDLILTLLTGVTVGVSMVINLSVKAFVSACQLVFSALKLAKIRALKAQLIKSIREATQGENVEYEMFEKRLIGDQCSVYASLLASMLEKEFDEFDDILMNKQQQLAKQDEFLKTKGLRVVNIETEAKELLIDQICSNDKDYCGEFLEFLQFDQDFINKSPTLLKKIQMISFEKVAGEANSMISVFKGRVASQNYNEGDLIYAKTLADSLLKNGYTMIFDSPRFAIFQCSLCAQNDLVVSKIYNFIENKDISTYVGTETGKHSHVQDTLQFLEVVGQKKESVEYSRFFVAGLEKKPDSPTSVANAKFKELIFPARLTETHGWIWKSESLRTPDFKMNLELKEKANNFQRDVPDSQAMSGVHPNLAILSVHQKTINYVMTFLNDNGKINILTTKVLIKHKQENPSHYFFLISLAKDLPFDTFQTEFNRACQTTGGKYLAHYCGATSLLDSLNALKTSDADFFNYDHFFTLYVEDYPHGYKGYKAPDFVSGIDATFQAYKTGVDQPWKTLGTRQYKLTVEEDEQANVEVFYKKSMRYQNFPKRNDKSVMDQLESSQAAMRTNLLSNLKEGACNNQCTNRGIIEFQNIEVCSATSKEWETLLSNKITETFENLRCFAPKDIASLKSHWNSVIPALATVTSGSNPFQPFEDTNTAKCLEKNERVTVTATGKNYLRKL